MDPTTIDTSEYLALHGPISLPVALAVGVALMLLFAWSLWSEHRILGQRLTCLFWLLRTVATVTVVWMLLAPNQVQVETNTTRRAVTILTDVSGSMRTVDPAGSADDVRWLLASSNDQKTATPAADRAVAAIGVAERHLHIATRALQRHEPETVVVDAVAGAEQAIASAVIHLTQAEAATTPAATGVSGDPAKTHSLASRLLHSLEGPEFRALAQLSRSLQKGRTPAEKGWRESLPDLLHRMAGVKSSAQELARLASVIDEQRTGTEQPTQLAAVQKAPRLNRVGQLLGSLQQTVLADIHEKADIRLGTFDRSVRRLARHDSVERALQELGRADDSQEQQEQAAMGTDIAEVIRHVNRERSEQPMAAVILLTDMGHNVADAGSPLEAATTLTDTPVYVVPIGNTRHSRDVILQSVTAPAVAMRNDSIVVEAHLQAYDCQGEVGLVQLLEGGKVVDFREVPFDSGFASRTVRFEKHMPTIGQLRFQIAVEPLQGELSNDNNFDEFSINVTRSDIKLLLSDEMPRWEYRYLAQLFRRDPKVACDELLFQPRTIATGRREETRTFPTTVEEWDQYDVVLLGDLLTHHLPAVSQETLIEYLQQRGGTLVMVAGPEAMPHAYVDHPLEQILPVLPVESTAANGESLAFQVTAEGWDLEALMIADSEQATRTAWDFVNQYSPLQWVSSWRQPRPSSHTLIAAVAPGAATEDGGKASAFLCWQPVGRGRIVYLSAPESYRLRFLRGDTLHYRFWGQLLRWAIATDLSPGTEFVRVRTDKTRYAANEAIEVTVRLAESAGQPVVTDDLQLQLTSAGDERTVPLSPVLGIPGQYMAQVQSLPAGVYQMKPVGSVVDELLKDSPLDPESTSFTVQANLPKELLDTRCDRVLAQQVADVSGGQVLPPTAVEEVLRLTNLEPVVTEETRTRPLWLQWKYLWIVFGCLQAEWIVRKWLGLS